MSTRVCNTGSPRWPTTHVERAEHPSFVVSDVQTCMLLMLQRFTFPARGLALL